MNTYSKYVLVWDVGIRIAREHYANTDDGRLTWTPHLTNPASPKGKPKIAHDRVATILTLGQAVAIKRRLCNPKDMMIRGVGS